ncbi:MAG TPA: alpha-amylase family glycosyl hydrolase [Kiritimatiellia bacterium]|nr:alpha-amylase family glycosyl hydrolase [Kiritimatiellia bacterium]
MKTMRFVAAVLAWMMGTLLAVQADPYWLTPRGAGHTYHPSPEDWRDINMYQIFTDRFFDGNPGNNNIRGWHTTDGYRHYAMGGDWAGVKEKLPYLAGMGVNAVWISGVQMNAQGVDTRYAPYHAYHPTDFYRVEPMFGTFDELKDLIDTAHSMGIYVILDVVINHMADLNGLGGGKDDYYHPWGGGNLFWWDSNKRHAWPFDGLQYFHNNGKILDWNDGGQIINGAFVGTDDLRTSDPYVQGHLIDIFKNLIDATDCDGFRVDAIKHVERDFMMHWTQTMRDHAAFRGKHNFLMFGEDFNYDDYQVGLQCNESRGGRFNSALYFPMQLTMRNVFAYEQGTRQITDRRNNLHHYGSGAQNLVAFMDNHDVDRIALEMGDAWETKLGPALTFLYTGTPVPCLFYGTEHGFNQGYTRNRGLTDGDYQREVMWNFGYQPGNAWGDKFYASGPYNYIKRLNELRSQHRSLTRGNFTTRWEENSKGIYAYTRQYGDEESLVIFNTDWGSKSAQPMVGKPNGTVFVNALNPTETLTVSDGRLNVTVGAKQSKIFIAGSSLSVQTSCDGGFVQITYDPASGPLANAAQVWIGYGNDGFNNHTSSPMTLVDGKYTFAYPESQAVRYLNFYFHDGLEPRTYDNRNGADWQYDVMNCRASGAAIAWMGGTYHWPLNDDLKAGDDLWINTHSEPIGAGGAAVVVYSADGGNTWQSAPMNHVGTTENNHDWWNINLGPFPAGSEIRYAVQVIGVINDRWDNNEGSNFLALVDEGAGSSIRVVGNTRHWPLNGNITSFDDVWVDVDSFPRHAGTGGLVVYSTDGVNWEIAPLVHNDGHDDENGGWDAWHLNLGKFPANTTIRYAIMVHDAFGVEYWDNNNGNDFLANVNPGGNAIAWFGNVRGAGVPVPETLIVKNGTGGTIIGGDPIKPGTDFSILRSMNLKDWAVVDAFTGANGTSGKDVAVPEGPGPFFFALRADRAPDGPVGAGEEVIVQIETEPAGTAASADLVFNVDEGETWSVLAMRHIGINGNRDIWTVSLGSYASGSSIRYAIALKDHDGFEVWDNNQGDDYQLLVVP